MILALIEHDRGTLNPTSLECLTLAREVSEQSGAPLEAVLIGEAARNLVPELGAYGVSRAHLVTHEGLNDYVPEAWARAVVQLMEALDPQAVAVAGSDRGNELMAHIAAISAQPFAANCVDVNIDDEYRVTRLRWGGSLLEEALLGGRPRLFSVALHALEPREAASGAGEPELETFTPQLDDKAFRVRIKERIESSTGGVSLSDARIVIGGGRGVGSPEGFACLEELAAMLGGAVGGSRVATNLGWRPHADQIGQTGTRIAPDLYIACGISGAIQHMVGAKGAKQILAINTDPEAPIMSKANYAVYGDLHEVVGAVIEELGRRKGA
jgi:electron transfer flavoprotein alpha subunit